MLEQSGMMVNFLSVLRLSDWIFPSQPKSADLGLFYAV
jgi:hypothetical protein